MTGSWTRKGIHRLGEGEPGVRRSDSGNFRGHSYFCSHDDRRLHRSFQSVLLR